jgi:D-beta-D-heptose 7-phosphate kinase/D-beta-D-heptose 1-phosphate adenosyltransferase
MSRHFTADGYETHQVMNKSRISKITKAFSGARLLVLGDIMLDRYIWGDVDRISPEAPVPVVNVNDETANLGGAANVAANVLALGAEAVLLGIVGNDSFADTLRGVLVENGLDDSRLVVDTNRPTTVKTRIVASSQQVARIDREITDEIGAPLVKEILDRMEKELARVDGIIISDYGKGVITYDLISRLVSRARKADKFVAVDPKEVHFKSYRNVSVITPNHHEAGFVSGKRITSDRILEEVGWELMDDLNIESLLITRGEKGMTLFESDRTKTDLPIEAKTVFDVTGAGDTVIASLAVAKSAGATMKEAAFISNVAAGLAVARFGTARITGDELVKALNDRP